MPSPLQAARRLILPALLLVLIALPLALGVVEVSRWLHDHHAAQEREEDQERRMLSVRWRLHVVGIAVEQLALGNIALLEAAAWERSLEPQPRRGREGADAELYCRHMLRHLAERARVSSRPEDAEALRRERAELQTLLTSPGALVLPEPPEPPGMPPRPEE